MGFFYIITLIILAVLIIFYIKETKYNAFMQVAISLLFAGALGNFIDRLFNGEVVDFIDTNIFGYDFPIFNIADSSLTIGVIFVIIALVKDATKRIGGHVVETYEYKIEDEALVGQRIDKLLSDFNSEWSRSQLQDWIKNDLVTVNGKIIKSNYKVKLNDEIQVTEKEVVEADILPENLNLDIYYEDEDVAIVYKPKGMVVHPSPGHYTGTLVNGLMYQIKDLSGINGEIRPGIVHRIDKDTSGLLMVAKNDIAHRGLVEQLMDKTVKRKYTALVHGNIPHDYGTIDAPIGRNKKTVNLWMLLMMEKKQ